MRTILCFAGVFINLLFCDMANAQKNTFNQNQVIAHRGAWKTQGLPENSIAALKEAIRLGCAGSEFDVYATADDTLVINHDQDFSGMSVEKNSYAQLCTRQLPNGETIPTLYNYIVEGMKQTGTRLVLEIKPSAISKERSLQTAEMAVAMVKRLHAETWVMYISFDYDVLLKVKSLDNAAQIAYLNGDKTPEQLHHDGLFGADYHYNVFKKYPNWLQEAKHCNINLNVWTVNNSELMDWLLDQQVNYITTNEPELLFERIKNRTK